MFQRRRALSFACTGAVLAVSTLAVSGADGRRAPSPVTDQMLANPSPNDWLSWRGTTRSQGYSPLDQIKRDNVKRLQVVWSWNLEPGNPEIAPIVHDGIMYIPNPGGIVHALDAATGEALWVYKPPAREGAAPSAGTMRGMAIYGDKVFVNVPDGRVVALNALTGAVAWTANAAPPGTSFGFEAAPLVTRGGKVVSAMTGCSRFIEAKCSLVAHDAESGKLLWRTETIQKSNGAGPDSWGNVPDLYRAGTEMWIPGSYDPDLNLIYWSTSQPKPWARAARGTDGDALYSNSTLAVDPETGKIVWHRQTIPGETHDLDEVFENVLVDDGARKSLYKMGKLSILWEIDRKTGRILRATDLGLQDVLDVNPKTGEVKYRADRIPVLDKEIEYCPGAMGGKNWPSMSYSPQTKALYIPYINSCIAFVFKDVEKKPGGGGAGYGAFRFFADPRAGGKLGSLVSLDLDGKVLWRKTQAAPFMSATLATAGGLLFVSDYDRYTYALDIKTGDVLWKARTASTGHGFPASYAVNGRQYIAVPIGYGSPWVDEYVPGFKLLPGIIPPTKGNGIVVFALP